MYPIFAVHISDGVLTEPWLVGGFAFLAIALGAALYRTPQDLIPRLGVLTAVFFVSSQQHLQLGPGSVHLLLNGLLGILLGWRCVIAIAVGLMLQAFLIGHGGQNSLGINFAVMAIPALMTGYIFRMLPKRRIYLIGYLLGSSCASLTVILYATVLDLGAKGDWTTIAKTSLLLHIPIIVLEGFILAFALGVLSKARPEWLGISPSDQSSGKTSANGTSH
jgi:cobalt/nickel transport system permease protein